MITKLLEKFNKEQLKKLPDLQAGDTIKVHQKIKEGNKERIQIFEGVIIAIKHGKGISATMTVRKIVDGVGVEKVFPIHSPSIDKIDIIGRAKVRRSKLYYLRTAKGKEKLKRKELSAAVATKEPIEAMSQPENPVPEVKEEKPQETQE